jgi:hypothetical protein
MRKSFWLPLLLIPVLVMLGAVGGRIVYYDYLAESPYRPPQREQVQVKVDAAPRATYGEAGDQPTTGQGVVVIDNAHNNAVFIEELNFLLSKIAARGFKSEIIFDNRDNESQELAGKLRYARALILPLAREAYTPEEIAEIEGFVEKGGRVLIIGDPTRTIVVEALNSIAGSFGIIFANDYLYSLEHNDNNYRNVIYSRFAESPITAGLDEDSKVTFYAGGSVNAPGHEIILGDETTYSSMSEGGRAVAAAVLAGDDRVLALGDVTFLTEPYTTIESNGILINNIANFLTSGRRDFELKDFPYFFNSDIEVVFSNSLVFNSQFADSVKLKEFLAKIERNVTFTDVISDDHDAIFIGRFADTEPVKAYLAAANITIINSEEAGEVTETAAGAAAGASVSASGEDTSTNVEERFIAGRIRIEGMGELERGGSTLFYLHQDGGRNVLIVLSDNPETNADAFNLLFEDKLADCLASAMIAVCQTKEPVEKLPPSLRRTRIDKILIVSDDDGHARADAETGLLAYHNVLSNTYTVDQWITSQDGRLDIDELLEYDAIIWTTGDYWDDSIAAEDAALLTRYVEFGGNLILSGASIAFDWDHTEFLTEVAHADYLTFAEQIDLEPALLDHPIARGFAEGQVISFTETVSGEPLAIDVVRHTSDSRVIFRRGPASEQPGAASVIAYEDERSKIVFFVFPIYLLPLEEQTLLVNNTLDWFTRKPLDLPAEDEYEPYDPDAGQPAEETGEAGDTLEEEAGETEDNLEEENGEDSGSEEEGE